MKNDECVDRLYMQIWPLWVESHGSTTPCDSQTTSSLIALSNLANYDCYELNLIVLKIFYDDNWTRNNKTQSSSIKKPVQDKVFKFLLKEQNKLN